MKDYVFFLHQVTPLRLEYRVIFKDVLQGDTPLHEDLHVEVTFNNHATEVTLLQTLFENVLLNSVHRDEAVDVHGFSLPDTMAAILGLLVHGWVPVRVIKDHAICPSEINTDATTASRRDETEKLLIVVEFVDEALTHLYFNRAVQSHVGVPVKV